jgi:membrane-associated phospholipid phosphatase
MKQKTCFIMLLLCCGLGLFGQELPETKAAEDFSPAPFSLLFHNIGWNTLHSFTFNYGQNFIISGLASYTLVHTGVDWEWNRLAVNNELLPRLGMPSGIIGFLLPVGLPLGLYFYGKSAENYDYQIAGLAMGQAAILAVGISTTMKAFTGRRPPGIMDKESGPDYSDDWAFGFMKREVFNGWPSSHTAVAFAMAAALTELYPDSWGLKIGAYSYSAFIGVGMSLMAHWMSEAVAGALVGYAIGKSVGAGYKGLMGAGSTAARPGGLAAAARPGELALTEKLSFYFTPLGTGFIIR